MLDFRFGPVEEDEELEDEAGEEFDIEDDAEIEEEEELFEIYGEGGFQRNQRVDRHKKGGKDE